MASAPDGTTRSAQSSGRVYTILALALGILALFIAPVITGALAIILGVVAYRRDHALGWWALGIAISGTVVGVIMYYGVRGHDLLQLY